MAETNEGRETITVLCVLWVETHFKQNTQSQMRRSWLWGVREAFMGGGRGGGTTSTTGPPRGGKSLGRNKGFEQTPPVLAPHCKGRRG